MTITEFVESNHITATVKPAAVNPNMPDAPSTTRHYRVTLKHDGRQMTVPFSMGAAFADPPTAARVLDCLANDSGGYETAMGFEDWCNEYGIDTEEPSERKAAAKTWRTIERQSEKLHTFLGSELYAELLWEVETN